MTGRITQLIDGQECGTIAGDDGVDYRFESRALVGVTFGSLQLGVRVAFVPRTETRRATAVRLA